MKEIIEKQIINDICKSFKGTIITGLDETPDELKCTESVIDFIVKLRKIGINNDVEDIITDSIFDTMYKEVSDFLN